MTDVEPITFPSTDGTLLEGEVAAVDGGTVAVLLCHPHPQYGGSMRSGLVGDLFRALPERGATALRFNFRGVEGSAGSWDEGRAERGDVLGALDALAGQVDDMLPVVLVGWSFGGDLALSTVTPRIAGWCAIAPPLRYASGLDALAADQRPKRIVLGARDDVASPGHVEEAVRGWTNTEVDVIPGASHFFLGKTDAVAASVWELCASVT